MRWRGLWALQQKDDAEAQAEGLTPPVQLSKQFKSQLLTSSGQCAH